eukprot:553278_1
MVHLKSASSEEDIERAFVERSMPDAALFRQHMSQAELVQLVRAADETVAAAAEFLRAAGATKCAMLVTRDVLRCDVSANTQFATSLGLTTDDFADTPQRPRRALTVAPAIRSAIEAMIVIGQVPKAPRVSNGKKDAGYPGMEQTPSSIKQRYNIPNGSVVAPATFSQGVGEFEQSHFTESDMQTFAKFFNLPEADMQVKGPNAGNQDRVEGTLDIQYLTALSGGVTTWWISQNMSNPDPAGLDFSWWADEVLSIPNPPATVSISWGMGEYRYKHDDAALVADNKAFRKLGLRGISVLAASGDSGPGARRFLSCTKFMPGWPSSSPYVTSVGATYATSESAPEESVSFSGGGFSDFFPTPSWQKADVATYLSSAEGLPKASFFNASGRGFPDVAALGTNFKIFAPKSGTTSTWWDVSGTSCAAPTFAAVVSRLNAARAQAGKPTLGFLNPALYKLGRVGNDITTGKSTDTDCFGIIPISGFPAAKGWDAISGLGTPDYDFLSKNL